MAAVDTYISYKFIRLITTDFKKWDAYKHGIIDDEGNMLRKAENQKEKDSFSTFHKLVKNIKKIILKLPFGKARISSLVAALYLLKEDCLKKGMIENPLSLEWALLEELQIKQYLDEDISYMGVVYGGKYKDDDSNIYIIEQNLEPIDIVLGIQVFEVFDVLGERRILTSCNLEKL